MFAKKFLSLSVVAAALAWAGVANASTITVTVTYAGSSSSTSLSLTAFPLDSGLTKLDLTSPTTQTTAGLKNFFDVWVKYTPTDPDNNALDGLVLIPQLPSNMVAIDSRGGTTLTNNKYFGISSYSGTTVFQSNADANKNLSNVVVLAVDAGTAYAELVGQAGASGTDIGTSTSGGSSNFSATLGTRLGRFGLAFTGAYTSGNSVVSLITPPGNSASEFTDPASEDGSGTPVGISLDNVTSVGVGVASAVPEPASLGVLALGGLALLARRRKAV